ncbi:MAG: type VI secretion system baseplate subunit TssK [Rubrivivax sp.]|nr:type VI secretion system baseplate subunit TssK [Rubrivivax sp.]
MSIDSARVAWTEGLFLRPQHFQQQERFLEWLLQSRMEQLAGFGYGFTQIVIDEGLRRQGKLALRAARGVLRDGTPFLIPQSASPVAPLDVPEGCRDAVVHLCAPLSRSGTQEFPDNSQDRALRRTRYDEIDLEVHNNTSRADAAAEVQAGVLSMSLVLESALEGTMTSLPVARIRERSPAGEVILDTDHIPPMLEAMAQPRLRAWVEELFGLMKQRGDMLEARIGQQGSKGIGDFLLLQTCNRHEPVFAQWRGGAPLHPRQLHEELLRLAGECRTVDAKSRRVPTFPTYAHTDLAACLAPVVEEIRRQLVAVPDQTAVPLPLVNLGRGYFGADIPDPRMIKAGHMVLGISAKLPDKRVRTEVPALVRIGSQATIQNLILAQVPGVRLDLLPGAPIEIQVHTGFHYFQLDRHSDQWPNIEATRRLILFVAGEPPGLDLELWSVRTA